jgi:ABC-type nitrate/sulfonate/bicarbonate transport system substrate-binding protein
MAKYNGRPAGQLRSQPAPVSASRREFIGKTLAVTGAGLGAGLAANLIPSALVGQSAYAAEPATDWGWPQSNKKISEKSVEWLKSKGWWPLQIAWNPLWSEGNVLLYVMQQQKMMEKRGVEVQYTPFLAASLMNEVYMPGRVQVAQAGSLGLLQVIDRKVPTLAVACYPAQRQAFLSPPDSPLKNGLIDLKGQRVLGRPGVVGITIGSTTHLALLIAVKVLGLEENKDFIMKNMAPADIIPMPKGVDVVGMWEPNVILMTEFLKNAKIIDLINNYEFFNGYSYMRGELEEGAPDVVQAYVDAFVEAQLYTRLKSAEVMAGFAADPSQRGRDPKLIERDATIHLLNPKPTRNYVFEDTGGLWIPLELYQSGIMSDAGVLRRHYTEADFKSVMRPKYMADTFNRLGWAIPKRPPFLPANWPGKIGHPPYPPYGIMEMGKQPFPEPGDLVRDWRFGGVTYKA